MELGATMANSAGCACIDALGMAAALPTAPHRNKPSSGIAQIGSFRIYTTLTEIWIQENPYLSFPA